MSKTFKPYVARPETIRTNKVNDWTLVCALAHPGYEPNLPVKLRSMIVSALSSLVDVPAPSAGGFTALSESSDDARKDMGLLVRLMLENVKISSFNIVKVR